MLVLKERETLDYPVTKEWLERVNALLDAMGHGSRAELGRFCSKKLGRKVGSGMLSDTLTGKFDTSPLVGAIHEFLNLPKPVSPLTCIDIGTLVWDATLMSEQQRESIVTSMDVMRGKYGEQARRALVEQLKLMRARPAND